MKGDVGIMAVVVAAIVFAGTVLFCADVHAQTQVEFKLLPPGNLGVVEGVKLRVYTLDEWLTLAAFDGELVKLRADVTDYKSITDKLKAVIVEKDKQFSTLEEDKGILLRRGLRLDGELEECEKKVIDLAGGPIWPYIVGAVGAVVGIVGVTMWAVGPARSS